LKAYNFSLPDQDGKMHALSDYLGKFVVLYFYPKDDTPGCTKEACAFRDASADYEKRGVVVIGISRDLASSHKKFADKFFLHFTLLSDPDHVVIEKYGAWGKKKFLGKEYDGILRNTILIDPKGEIVKEYKAVNPLTHADEILKDIKRLQN